MQEMMNTLRQLLEAITTGALIPAEMFARDDLDEILDRRDEGAFEKPWMACFERITAAWKDSGPSSSMEEVIDEVRKESFLVVSRATHQAEIASYVSDDFELISKSIALELNDDYADQLLKTYGLGKIPGAEPEGGEER